MSTSASPRASPDQKKHVKFDHPFATQTFTCFSRLPQELQDEIWESTVDDPGVHWLSLEHPTWDTWGSHRMFTPALHEDPIKLECRFETTPLSVSASLQHPEYQHADKSWHKHVQKQMAAVGASCRMGQLNMNRMTDYAEITRFVHTKNGPRRWIMLDASRDLVLLDYLPPHRYQSDCGLDILFNDEQHLSRFRNVAVRYHPEWSVDTDLSKCCPKCGRIHRTKRNVAPRHLYHFLARNFPLLERVWLVDYMMLEKGRSSNDDDDCGHDSEPQKESTLPSATNALCTQGKTSTTFTIEEKPEWYRAIDRTFHEATPESWHIKDRVVGVKDWLQDAYIRYSNNSRFACHESPEMVKFGILGCRHENRSPVSADLSKPVVRLKKRRAHGDPNVRKKSKRKLCSDQNSFYFYFDKPYDHDQIPNLPIHYFGSGTLDWWDFEFRMSRLSLGDYRLSSRDELGEYYEAPYY